MAYTIIGHPKNRAMRILWMLEELDQPWEFEMHMPRTPEMLAANPSGKGPVLRDGEALIIDSVAAITYLTDKHGACTYPAGTPERAQQDSYLHFALDEMDAVLWSGAKATFVLPEEYRVKAIKDVNRFEFARSMGWLEARLGDGPWLMGDRFTVPDLIMGHCANWAKNAKFEFDQPRVAEYFERVLARPARAAAIAKADAVVEAHAA